MMAKIYWSILFDTPEKNPSNWVNVSLKIGITAPIPLITLGANGAMKG